ncbi:MAG: DUF2092 domain-containing protein [Candidatus Hydrogenedentes bacterium]|nr:DUF2092 domain-containing protein [Candidatus Hydrogenedentota bacterium]
MCVSHRPKAFLCVFFTLALCAALCSAEVILGPPPKSASSTGSLPDDAQAVLSSFSQFCAGLTSFTVDTRTTLHRVVGDDVQDIVVDYAGAMRKPSCFAMNLTGENRGAEVISDGTTLSLSIPALGRYTQLCAPADITVAAASGDMGIGITAAYPSVIEALLSPDPSRELLAGAATVDYLGTAQSGEASEHHFKMMAGGVPIDFWIMAGDTPALTRFRADYSSMLRASLEGATPTRVELFFTFEFLNWSFNPEVPDSRFAFTPPADAELHRNLRDLLTTRPSKVSPMVGKQAPQVPLDLLDGGTLDLAALQKEGKVVVLDFWATWCVQCVNSLPDLTAALRKYAERGVAFYAVNQAEAPEIVRAFLASQKLDMNVALDIQETASIAYQLIGVPETFVVGKNGVILAHHVGFGPTSLLELRLEIEAALKGKALELSLAQESTS